MVLPVVAKLAVLHINIRFAPCKLLEQLFAAKGVFKLFAEIGMHGLRTDFNQFVKVALIGACFVSNRSYSTMKKRFLVRLT